ncbi:hypothetical protein U1701_09000 [Sphingomonas sp. PB2P19]|uniref:hypothetical protein n=1 Tax=Sphingomonas rhamnosi TaxID=3096156 RepID=UPI002FCB7B59
MIDEGGRVEGDCTWNALERWQVKTDQAHCADMPEIDNTQHFSDLITRVRCHARQDDNSKTKSAVSGTIVMYVPGSATPKYRDSRYKPTMTAMLKPLQHSYVRESSTWLQKPGDEAGGFGGSELVIHTGDLDLTLRVLTDRLPKTDFAEGIDLQYDVNGQLYFTSYSGTKWSKPARISARDCGRAMPADRTIKQK